MKEENKIRYRVIEVRKETDHVTTLALEREDGEVFSFIAGQYVTAYFPESGTPEGKAYSISGRVSEKRFTISVKAMGEFSNRLVGMKSGDILTGSNPYGYFYSEEENTPLVMIAAGIGAAPFHAIIFEALKKRPLRKIFLFHSSKKAEELVFKKEFGDLAARHPSLKIFYHITQEDAAIPFAAMGRINVKRVLDAVSEEIINAEFMICGSISFTRDMWRGLHDSGVSEEKIYTEAFF